ncbi:MAG: hypothetical protein H0W64_11660 [Gammaproteobacteria bacterium]|nr:hypothetical protein [Gammaproteobacteria bacterium]
MFQVVKDRHNQFKAVLLEMPEFQDFINTMGDDAIVHIIKEITIEYNAKVKNEKLHYKVSEVHENYDALKLQLAFNASVEVANKDEHDQAKNHRRGV